MKQINHTFEFHMRSREIPYRNIQNAQQYTLTKFLDTNSTSGILSITWQLYIYMRLTPKARWPEHNRSDTVQIEVFYMLTTSGTCFVPSCHTMYTTPVFLRIANSHNVFVRERWCIWSLDVCLSSRRGQRWRETVQRPLQQYLQHTGPWLPHR